MKKGTEILQFMNAMHTCSAIKKHFQHEYIFFGVLSRGTFFFEWVVRMEFSEEGSCGYLNKIWCVIKQKNEKWIIESHALHDKQALIKKSVIAKAILHFCR